jgi:hypothetical protein
LENWDDVLVRQPIFKLLDSIFIYIVIHAVSAQSDRLIVAHERSQGIEGSLRAARAWARQFLMLNFPYSFGFSVSGKLQRLSRDRGGAVDK